MKKIVFEFKDEYTKGEWRERECIVESLEQCIKFYGLNECEYRIISITDIN